jgi:hypothetical protein
MASLVCPWWPTGLGLYGAGVALLQAAAVSLGVRWISYGSCPPPRNHPLLWAAACLAIPATLFYIPYCIDELPVFAGGAAPVRILSFFLSTGTVLLPVMWASIILWLTFCIAMVRGRSLVPGERVLFALTTSCLLMSLRTLFGGTLSQLTLVAVAAYPLLFALAPLLVQRAIDSSFSFLPIRRTALTVPSLVVIYGVLRFGAAIAADHTSNFDPLHTEAGLVYLSEASKSSAVYRYVRENTNSSDAVVDIAYGGAVNFAGRRASPIYSTQFSALAPGRHFLQLDLDRIRARPPALVIADAKPDFGAAYGLCAETGCTFPSLVWRSRQLACDPSRTFPVLEFIRDHYAPVTRFGDKTVYRRKPGLQAAFSR